MSGARPPASATLADDTWTTRARVAGQIFRVASVLAPTAIAWSVLTKLGDRNAPIHPAVGHALALLWCALLVSFLTRVAAITRHRRSNRSAEAVDGHRASVLDHIDILTPSGTGLSWLGAGALVLSTRLEWSSVSLVGMIGLAFFHVIAIWATWAVSGVDPWRRSSFVRRFTTERAVEGDPVIEEVCFSAPRIPTGFRLFARGRVGPRWSTSRYVVEGEHDGSEIRLQADVGPAVRGEHDAEPLEIWLQDVFGLCRSISVFAGAAPLVVLPRERALRGDDEILRAHGEIDAPRPATHMPTEGSMQLRDYRPGDDARRIHWARSLSTGQTIVRTPDEVPHDRRAVRVVLDTHLPGAQDLACTAPAELLDTLVALWIGVARTFAAAGIRVDLVFAGPDGVVVTPLRHREWGRMRGLQGPAEEVGARAMAERYAAGSGADANAVGRRVVPTSAAARRGGDADALGARARVELGALRSHRARAVAGVPAASGRLAGERAPAPTTRAAVLRAGSRRSRSLRGTLHGSSPLRVGGRGADPPGDAVTQRRHRRGAPLVIARRLRELSGQVVGQRWGERLVTRVGAWTRPWGGRLGAPLLHWLVLLSGLALLAFSDVVSEEALTSLFLGAVVGTACGQAFAALRLRMWSASLATLLLVSIVAMSIARFHGAVDAMLEAFLPAVACGYLSLTGRSALASFWFPTVPWALVLIAADDPAASAPSWLLWGGLVGLLAATLWARERRRIAQWKTHALEDLAEPAEQVVLREAPLRKEARLAWTVAVSIATVVLAAWIAPLLRRYEPGQSGERIAHAAGHEPLVESDFITDLDDDYEGELHGVCCPHDAPVAPPPRRVREYVTPRDTREAAPLPAAVTPAPTGCVPCSEDAPSDADHALARGRRVGSDNPVEVAGRATTYWHGSVQLDPIPPSPPRTGGTIPPATTAAPPPPPLPPPPAETIATTPPLPVKTAAPPPPPAKTAAPPPPAKTAAAPPPVKTAAKPPPAKTAAKPPPAKTTEPPPAKTTEPPPAKTAEGALCEGGPCTASAQRPPVATPFPAKASAPRIERRIETRPRSKPTTWQARAPVHVESDHTLLRVLIAGLVAALAVHLVLRPIRRWFILRHLRQPWWNETVIQRVSNLWQLALLGLRDAGWRPEPGEPPQQLATRVGVEGMKRCADILERARHGVRVDARDLVTMERAAERAFAGARERAGLAARIASWWRSPTA